LFNDDEGKWNTIEVKNLFHFLTLVLSNKSWQLNL
jgi:hypothetical protein